MSNTPSKISFNLGIVKAGSYLTHICYDYPIYKCVADPSHFQSFTPSSVQLCATSDLTGAKSNAPELKKISANGRSLKVNRLDDFFTYDVLGETPLEMGAVFSFEVESKLDHDVVLWATVSGHFQDTHTSGRQTSERQQNKSSEDSGLLSTVRRTVAKLCQGVVESVDASLRAWREVEDGARQIATSRSSVEASAAFGPVVVDGRTMDHPNEDLVSVVIVRFARPFVPRVLWIAPRNVTSFTIVDLRVRRRIPGECSLTREVDVRGLGQEGRLEELFGRSVMLSLAPMPGLYFADGGGAIYCDPVGTDEELCIFVRNSDAAPAELSGLVVGDVLLAL